MPLISFRLAGSGGEDAYVNPGMVVCLMQAGKERTQVVTAGLAGESSISIVVAMGLHDVAARLNKADADGGRLVRSEARPAATTSPSPDAPASPSPAAPISPSLAAALRVVRAARGGVEAPPQRAEPAQAQAQAQA
jgi:hypothetical protein